MKLRQKARGHDLARYSLVLIGSCFALSPQEKEKTDCGGR